jgi:hypothetical protein
MHAVRPQPSAADGSTTKHCAEPSGVDPRWVDTLFARFTAIWPAAMADRLATIPRADHAHEWELGLVGLSAEQIKHGINRARRESPWPPSIAEFRALCTDGRSAEQRAFDARAAAADAEHALPTKTWAETRESGRRHLRELKAALRGGPREPTT